MEVARQNLKDKYPGVLSDDEELEVKQLTLPAPPVLISKEHVIEATGEKCLEAITDLVLREGNFGGFGLICAEGLSQLEMLSLSNNKIKDLTSFSNFANLLDLNLNFNQISSLEGLKAPKLQRLFISNNRLLSLDGVRGFPRLEELCVYRNQLGDLEATVASCRQSLPKLRSLDLGGNPCSFGPAYRHTVVRALIRLKQLDGEPLTPLDKDLAALYFTEHTAPKFNQENRPTTAPAILPGHKSSKLGPETSVADAAERGRPDPFSGFLEHEAIRGKVRLVSSTKLNNDPTMLSYMAEDVLSNQGTGFSKKDFLEGFKEKQKNAARPATACIDTSKSFVSRLRGANSNQPQVEGTVEGTEQAAASSTKKKSHSRSSSIEDHSHNPTPPPARQEHTHTPARTRKRSQAAATPEPVYDASEAVRPTESDIVANRPSSSEGSLTARIKKAGQTPIDPSNPFATIQKLLKLIEILQAERNLPEDQEISSLKREIEILRLENQNMYALKEENRNLKNENEELRIQLEQCQEGNQKQGITIGGLEDSNTWNDAKVWSESSAFLADSWGRPFSRSSSRNAELGSRDSSRSIRLSSRGSSKGGGPQDLDDDEEVQALITARSQGRPQTALEIIEETEEVDIELAELIRVNQNSLKEIRREMKETEKMLDRKDSRHRMHRQKKRSSTKKESQSSERENEERGTESFVTSKKINAPSMKVLLKQRKAHKSSHVMYNQEISEPDISYKSEVSSASKLQNEALAFSSQGDHSSGEESIPESIITPEPELLFAFTGELDSKRG